MHVAREFRYQLGDLRFSWDLEEHRQNIVKHGIAFEEAATTWLDPNAIEADDEGHSEHEDRWLRVGMSLRGLVLVTWSAIRDPEGEAIVRIIGSRRAIKAERKLYEETRR